MLGAEYGRKHIRDRGDHRNGTAECDVTKRSTFIATMFGGEINLSSEKHFTFWTVSQ